MLSVCCLSYVPSSVGFDFPSGIDLTGSTAGFAFVGTMCSETHSVGLTEDGGRNLVSTASTAAHELGHIFNMNHDGNVVFCACKALSTV